MTTEFLTDREVAARLRWSRETLRKKVRAGVFIEGVHYFKPEGCGRRWEWPAVIEWLRASAAKDPDEHSPVRLASGGGRDLL